LLWFLTTDYNLELLHGTVQEIKEEPELAGAKEC